MPWRLALPGALLVCCIQIAHISGLPNPGDVKSRPIGVAPQASNAETTARIVKGYARLPLSFEVNEGQAHSDIRFFSRGPSYDISLAPTEAVLRLPRPDATSATIRMRLVDANPGVLIRGEDQQPGTVNYFVGNDPSKWRRGVATYGRVRYDEVYRGIDLTFYGNQQQLEYDFIVQPGADPSSIGLAFDGTNSLQIDDGGDLVLETPAGEIRQLKPLIYQERTGLRRFVKGRYVLKGQHHVGFELDAYDSTLPLVIDPVIVYSTLVGLRRATGAMGEMGVAVHGDNAYIATTTLATVGAPSFGALGEDDVLIAKLNATGTSLMYATYVGGRRRDRPGALVVDPAGNAIVVGSTDSADLPTTPGAWDRSCGTDGNCNPTPLPDVFRFDAFVVKLDSAGALMTSTYLGGADFDFGFGVTTDTAGNIYVSGGTDSADFPTVGGAQLFYRGNRDAFVTKLDPTGSALLYSTYVGGSGFDEATRVALDASGSLYVTGATSSPNFPTASAVQPTYGGGFSDAYVLKLTPSGGGLVYATYLGTTTTEHAFDIGIDAAGRTYIVGSRTTNVNPSVFDGFVTSLSASGNSLVYSIPLGGSDFDEVYALAVNPNGDVFVGGGTRSADFPFAVPIDRIPNSLFTRPFIAKIALEGDNDSDGMPDSWETQFGLNPSLADAGLDPDGDGKTNLQEFQTGTHPRGFHTGYFAEGASSDFLSTSLSALNPSDSLPATVLVRNLNANGTNPSTFLSIEPQRSRRMNLTSGIGLHTAEFSTIVESDVPLALDRTMTWDRTAYGSHLEAAIPVPALSWYVPEGVTWPGFQLFYVIANPNDLAATVTVNYVRGPVRVHQVQRRSRHTIWVNRDHPTLLNRQVAASIGSNVPIVVDRSAYFDAGGTVFAGGHTSSASLVASADRWFFAEGATGPDFDTFLVVLSTGPAGGAFQIRYLLPDGTTITKSHLITGVGPVTHTVWVDQEDPRLANASFSMIVEQVPGGAAIVPERVMYWTGSFPNWRESHSSLGARATGTRWAFAEGHVAPNQADTYILIANTSPFAGSVRVRLVFQTGLVLERTIPVAATSRTTLCVSETFPESVGSSGMRFGAIIESLGGTPAQIVVERSIYSDANGVRWAAGANALATLLP